MKGGESERRESGMTTRMHCYQRTWMALDVLMESANELHAVLSDELAALEDVGEFNAVHPALAMGDFVGQVKFLKAYLGDYVAIEE